MKKIGKPNWRETTALLSGLAIGSSLTQLFTPSPFPNTPAPSFQGKLDNERAGSMVNIFQREPVLDPSTQTFLDQIEPDPAAALFKIDTLPQRTSDGPNVFLVRGMEDDGPGNQDSNLVLLGQRANEIEFLSKALGEVRIVPSATLSDSSQPLALNFTPEVLAHYRFDVTRETDDLKLTLNSKDGVEPVQSSILIEDYFTDTNKDRFSVRVGSIDMMGAVQTIPVSTAESNAWKTALEAIQKKAPEPSATDYFPMDRMSELADGYTAKMEKLNQSSDDADKMSQATNTLNDEYRTKAEWVIRTDAENMMRIATPRYYALRNARQSGK